MGQLNPRHGFQQRGREVGAAAIASRAKGEFSRPLARAFDQLLEGADIEAVTDIEDRAHTPQRPYGHEIARRVEAGVTVQFRVDGVGRLAAHQHRVAIGRGAGGGFGADAPAAADPVLDHHRLSELARKRLGHQPREDIGRTARWERHDDANRAGREGLGLGRRPAPDGGRASDAAEERAPAREA